MEPVAADTTDDKLDEEPFAFVLVAQSAFTPLEMIDEFAWIADLGVKMTGFGGSTDEGCTMINVEGPFDTFCALGKRVPLHVLPLGAVPTLSEGWLVAMDINGQLIYPEGAGPSEHPSAIATRR